MRGSVRPSGAARLEPLSDALLAMSVILTGAPGFRIGGIPVGPGEAGLLLWIGLRSWQEIFLRSHPMGAPEKVLATFWVVFTAVQCVGLMMSMVFADLIDWPIVIHDIVAFVLMVLFSMLCLSLPDAASRFVRITRYAMLFGFVSLMLQVASAWNLISVPGIDPWYWDRFRGWADNPNQLSLFCAILVPIALFGAETGQGRFDRLNAFGCAAAALAAGMLTRGNSLRLALALGVVCSIVIIVARTLAPGRGRPKRRDLPAALAIVSVPVLLMSCLPFAATFKTEDIAQVSRDSTETLGEAALRFELWNEAFGQGLRSLYLGLGPGPHARVPPEIAVRQRWEPGADDPSLGDVAKHGAVMESHNTYVELFSQGGLMVVFAYVGLLVYALRQSIASRFISLPALVCVIASFGFFHVVLRHPIVWFGLCLCLGSARPRGAEDVAVSKDRTRECPV